MINITKIGLALLVSLTVYGSPPADVKSFGAVGDGISDDTAAIQAAVDTERDIFVSAGRYKISSPIIVRQSGTIAGAGSRSEIFYTLPHLSSFANEPGHPVSAALYVTNGISDVVIRDLSVKGSWISGMWSNTCGVLLGTDTINCTISGVWSSSHHWSGLYSRGKNNRIIDCQSNSNAIDGIEISTLASGNHVSRCFTRGNGFASHRSGASVEVSGTDNTIANVQSDDDYFGVSVSPPAEGISVTGTRVLRASSVAFLASGDGLRNVTFSGNTAKGARGVGSYANSFVIGSSVNGFILIGNSSSENNLTGNHGSGIVIASGAKHGIVKGNLCKSNWVGISVTGPVTGIFISDNIAVEDAAYNIYDASNGTAAFGTNIVSSPSGIFRSN